MITAVDTTVVLDILAASPRHLERSRSLFAKAREEGRLIVCPVVWAELCPFFDSEREMEDVLDQMSVVYDDFGPSVASRAGELWQKYRKGGGPRQRLIPDFLVGAHALLKASRLLTRDRGFYRAYFKELVLLDPSSDS